MPRKIIKDVFLRGGDKDVPLSEELRNDENKKTRFVFKITIAVLIVAIIVAFFYVFLSKISSTVVNISLFKETIEVDSRLRAYADPAITGLSFETMQLSVDDSAKVVPTGVSSGGQKSSGKITVYNNYSNAPQKLITNTRFETKEGKIFRIKEPIVVPGMGMIETMVYADQAGDSYNIEASDFTVPGLKGGPRFEKVFAKSKTAMTGGSSGNIMLVKKEDIESVRVSLREKTKARLLTMLSNQKPEGYLLFDDAIKVEYEENSENPKGGQSSEHPMNFNIKAVATGYLFKKDSLSKALVDNNAGKFTVKSPKNDILSVDNIENLDFNLISVNSQNKEVAISLKGKADFSWVVDTTKLLKDISSYKGKDYNAVFQNYPSIEKASVIIYPSWWKVVPKDSSKIKLNIDAKDVANEEKQQ